MAYQNTALIISLRWSGSPWLNRKCLPLLLTVCICCRLCSLLSSADALYIAPHNMLTKEHQISMFRMCKCFSLQQFALVAFPELVSHPVWFSSIDHSGNPYHNLSKSFLFSPNTVGRSRNCCKSCSITMFCYTTLGIPLRCLQAVTIPFPDRVLTFSI